MWERESVAARADRLTGVVWDVDAAAVVGRPYWLVWSMWTIQATAMSSSFVAVVVGVVIVGVVVVGVVVVGVVVVGVVIVVCRCRYRCRLSSQAGLSPSHNGRRRSRVRSNSRQTDRQNDLSGPEQVTRPSRKDE